MHEYKSNRELLEEYNAYVFGHTEAKKAIINLLNRSRLRYIQKYKHLDSQYSLLEPAKILLIGKSGHGKTHLVETAAKLIKFPLVKIDATKLSPTGGGDGINSIKLKEMILDKARMAALSDPRYHSEQGAIDQTVVFVDEIDKLAKPSDSSGRWNTHVQHNFLTLFEDKEELAGVSFIFAGAFTGIDEQTRPGKSMGFVARGEDNNPTAIEWDREIIKYGIVPELVGRINGIYHIADLRKKDYRKILLEILLPQKQYELMFYNYMDFKLSRAVVNEMVETAFKSEQGVRSLKRQLNAYVSEKEFYYEDKSQEMFLLGSFQSLYESQHSIFELGELDEDSGEDNR